MARDPILWMRQEYSDIVETVRSHATKIVKHDRIRGGGDGDVPPEQLTANSNLPPLKLNAKLTSSGNTLSLVSIDSGVIHNYDDPANGGQGWVQSTLISQVDLSTAGSITDRKYDVFEYYDSQLAVPGSNIEILAWTDENNRAVSLDTVDGARLKSTDYSRRYVGTGRYDGSSLYIASQDNNGISWYGTGNPYDPTGADPFTGILITADGVYGYLAGVVQASLTALGKILAGASAVILDALGITVTASGSGFSAGHAYKFINGTSDVIGGMYGDTGGLDQIRVAALAHTGSDGALYLEAQALAAQIAVAQIRTILDDGAGGHTYFTLLDARKSAAGVITLDLGAANGASASANQVNIKSLGGIDLSAGSPITMTSIAPTSVAATGLISITNTAPTFDMTDSTGSAKSLRVKVDGNLVQLREQGGADGSFLVMDLANIRLGLGVNPTVPLDIVGAGKFTGALAVGGNLDINTNKFNVTGSSGALAMAGDLAINTNKFTVTASSGNTSIGGDLTIADTKNIILNTGTGTQIGTGTTQKLGFWGATPVARQTAFVQTYATTSKAHNNPTSATLTDSSGGTANTTLQNIGAAYSQAEVANNFADCAAMINKLTADMLNVKNVINAIIDDGQAVGLLA